MSLNTSTNNRPAPTNSIPSTAARKLFEGLRTDFNTLSTQPPLLIFQQPPRTTFITRHIYSVSTSSNQHQLPHQLLERMHLQALLPFQTLLSQAIAIASTSVFILLLIILFICISRMCNTCKQRKKSANAVDSLPRQQYRQLHNSNSNTNIPRNSDSSPTNKTGNPALDALIGNTPTFHERTPGKSFIITPRIVAGGSTVRASPAVVASAEMATVEEVQPILRKKQDVLGKDAQASIQILEEHPIKGAPPL
ncbi:hypothetical protein BJ741DRAFT_632431 [Chytriomyces cf. hyalinus JEL632]|nr:hypothetical protein BJ741DRAFT_632431 [Chytriomyces cf. hyalinus JEL632]